MAVSEDAKLMLTCGMPDDDTEVWAGRGVTADHDVRFLPFVDDQRVTSELDAAHGRARIDIEQGADSVCVESEAPLTDFYDQVTRRSRCSARTRPSPRR